MEGDVRGRCGEGSAQTSPARVDGQPDSLCKKEKGTFQPSFHGGIREKKKTRAVNRSQHQAICACVSKDIGRPTALHVRPSFHRFLHLDLMTR